MKTIYGPVPSWRLGKSLGVDLLSKEKTCPFECIYCQLGKTLNKTTKRKEFVKTEKVIDDLKEVLPNVKADRITFSGNGEQSLAFNLGEVIDEIRKITKLPLAILTSSVLMDKEEVRKDLRKLDMVVAKLEAPNERILQEINGPAEGVTLKKIISGITAFRREYTGKLALQIMFVKENKEFAKEIAEIAKKINPDEVQLNTPLRKCPVTALSRKEMDKIKKEFVGLRNVKMIYEERKPKVTIINKEKTEKLRPDVEEEF